MIFNIDECEKQQICSVGKQVLVWENGSDYIFGIVDKKLLDINAKDLDLVIKDPQNKKAILKYIKENECGNCVVLRFVTEDRFIRSLTAEEFEIISKLFPELPYCPNQLLEE